MQKSVKRGTLWYVPLDVVCGVVDYFEHVEELKCEGIKDPQQVRLYNYILHPCGRCALCMQSLLTHKRNTDNKTCCL